MTVDDSFTKPGSIPFAWELRPGIPKTPIHPNPQPPPQPPVTPPHQALKPPPCGPHFSPPENPRTGSFRSASKHHSSSQWSLELPPVGQRAAVTVVKPPPYVPHSSPPDNSRLGSLRSASKNHSSARWSLELPRVAQRAAVTVVSSGCFPARRKEGKKRRGQSKLDPNYVSDTETPSFWSVSSRRSSVSPLQGSPSSSAYSFRSFQSSPRRSVSSYVSSYKASPQRMSDAEWAAFGLF